MYWLALLAILIAFKPGILRPFMWAFRSIGWITLGLGVLNFMIQEQKNVHAFEMLALAIVVSSAMIWAGRRAREIVEDIKFHRQNGQQNTPQNRRLLGQQDDPLNHRAQYDHQDD